MPGTAECHAQVADARLPQAAPVFHNATALHAPIDLLDALPAMMSGLVGQPLLQGELLAPGLLRRMAFTSGTTGNPKGVTHSCNTTLAACRILNDAMQVGEHEVFLIYLPLGLNWGYLTLLQALLVGARAVLLERFSARAALELNVVTRRGGAL
jgi:acyl-CoA synthetase (AMP-forming)/AMP-acid ligase II